MKKYKLNKAYIDRELALFPKEDPAVVVAICEKRLNEQARDCKNDIVSWALQGMSVEEIKEQLVDWNNHTLANHIEVIRDIYRDAIFRRDNKGKMLTYHRKPTKAEIAFGYGATHYIDVPFEDCINREGNIKKRIKSKDGLWYSR